MSIEMQTIRSDRATSRPLPGFGYVGAERACGGSGQAALYDDLRSLDRFSARVRFGKNETIFSEGEHAGHAYKIVSGMVRLCKHTQDGRRQIADFLLIPAGPEGFETVAARSGHAVRGDVHGKRCRGGAEDAEIHREDLVPPVEQERTHQGVLLALGIEGAEQKDRGGHSGKVIGARNDRQGSSWWTSISAGPSLRAGARMARKTRVSLPAL